MSDDNRSSRSETGTRRGPVGTSPVKRPLTLVWNQDELEQVLQRIDRNPGGRYQDAHVLYQRVWAGLQSILDARQDLAVRLRDQGADPDLSAVVQERPELVRDLEALCDAMRPDTEIVLEVLGRLAAESRL